MPLLQSLPTTANCQQNGLAATASQSSHRLNGHTGLTLRISFSLCFALTLGLLAMPLAAASLQPDLEALQAFELAREEIKSRRFDRAEILLERVLMLQPENAEARIELALLMAGRGNRDGAQALLQSLIDDARTDLLQAQELKNLQAFIRLGKSPALGLSPFALNAPARLSASTRAPNPSAASHAIWRGELSLGRSSNPLARTAAQAITITLPDGALSLPLTQTDRAGIMSGANLSRTTDTGGFELALQGANVTGASTASRAVVWGRLPLAAWPATQNWPPVLAYLLIQRGLDRQHRAQTGLTAIGGQQKYSLSNYYEYSSQDHGMIWRLEHRQPRWLGADWFATVERSKSATGPQAYWRASVVGEYPLRERAKLSLEFAKQEDSYAYSYLLENGAHRNLKSLHVVYEKQHALEGEKTFVWRVFTGERQSNLSLFDYKETGFKLSLVNKWR